MTISATIISDSISPEGIRLTSFQLRYPRFIHSELMTHRVFSRNASSSRAIPVKTMIEELIREPALPVYWGSNKPGMQAGQELTGDALEVVKMTWLAARNQAISATETLMSQGLHKQLANRILEPWAHINVLVTATDYQNFYTLRRHKDAQPEIKELADRMWEAAKKSNPSICLPGQWHLPYVNQDEQSDDRNAVEDYLDTNPNLGDNGREKSILELLKRVSVARCARVSYLTHEGKQTTVEEDLALYTRLLGAQPLHASPAEHQATPDNRHLSRTDDSVWKNPKLHGNLRGWVQLRKTIEGEFIYN